MYNLFIYLVSRLNDACKKLCTFLGHPVLIDKLVAMETLLSWQQANCEITLLCESILSSYMVHLFFVTKHITGIPGSYGSTVTMATKDCSITQQY